MQSEQHISLGSEERRTTLDMDVSNFEEGPKSSLLIKEKGGSSSSEEISTLSYHRLNSNTSQTPGRKPDMKLQIPSSSVDTSEYQARLASTPPTSSSRAAKTLSSKSFQSRLSFRSRLSFSQQLKKGAPNAENSKSRAQHALEAQTSLPSPYLLSKLLRTLSGKTSSLPLTLNTELREIANSGTPGSPPKPSSKGKIGRSLSVPANKIGSLRRTSTTPGVTLLVKPLAPRKPDGEFNCDGDVSKIETTREGDDEDGERIAQDEAICRICFDELREGGPTLKMECSCKGELALAHEECALKWFSIKGNPTCDICGEEVKNLPVTIMRLSNDNSHVRQQPPRVTGIPRLCQDIPVLVMISMLGYFCLFEQLLISTEGTNALAISLPFACILGLLASLTASTLAGRKYIWAYATLQFTLVILFSHIFYAVLHLQAVLAILLASLAGFGISMSVNALILDCAKWRTEQAVRHPDVVGSFPDAV